MNTTTFVETRTNKVASFETSVTVSRAPASLAGRTGRWLDTVGADRVVACFEVSVTFKGLSWTPKGGEKNTSTREEWSEKYFEIVTATGRGVVISFQGAEDELMAFIPNAGKTLVHGCWKKYGQYRGHAVAYLRANGKNVNSRAQVDHTCPMVIYNAAMGK